MDLDIIFGLHSIAEAIKNPARETLELYTTEESLTDLKKLHFKNTTFPEKVSIKLMSVHKLKDEGKKVIRDKGLKEQRIPSQCILMASPLPEKSLGDVYKTLEKGGRIRILALDQVTDIHNLGAILRTAAFYNLDFVIYGKKGKQELTPGLFRIASGATEHVPLVATPNLSRAVKKLSELDVHCIGLAEEAEQKEVTTDSVDKVCLVMGAEDTGLSHATRRVLEEFVSLKSQGQIKSLNVSVAAALAMEKFLN